LNVNKWQSILKCLPVFTLNFLVLGNKLRFCYKGKFSKPKVPKFCEDATICYKDKTSIQKTLGCIYRNHSS